MAEGAQQSSCLFCTSPCSIKFTVDTSGKLVKVNGGGNVLSSDERGSLVEPEIVTIDFLSVIMLNTSVDIWNGYLSQHGVTNGSLIVCMCDTCEAVVYKCFDLHSQITKMLDVQRRVVRDKIFKSGPIPNDDLGQSDFWNSVRKDAISDLLDERTSHKVTGARNGLEVNESKPDINLLDITPKSVINNEILSVNSTCSSFSKWPDDSVTLDETSQVTNDSKTAGAGTKENAEKTPSPSSLSDIRRSGDDVALPKKKDSLSVPAVSPTRMLRPSLSVNSTCLSSSKWSYGSVTSGEDKTTTVKNDSKTADTRENAEKAPTPSSDFSGVGDVAVTKKKNPLSVPAVTPTRMLSPSFGIPLVDKSVALTRPATKTVEKPNVGESKVKTPVKSPAASGIPPPPPAITISAPVTTPPVVTTPVKTPSLLASPIAKSPCVKPSPVVKENTVKPKVRISRVKPSVPKPSAVSAPPPVVKPTVVPPGAKKVTPQVITPPLVKEVITKPTGVPTLPKPKLSAAKERPPAASFGTKKPSATFTTTEPSVSFSIKKPTSVSASKPSKSLPTTKPPAPVATTKHPVSFTIKKPVPVSFAIKKSSAVTAIKKPSAVTAIQKPSAVTVINKPKVVPTPPNPKHSALTERTPAVPPPVVTPKPVVETPPAAGKPEVVTSSVEPNPRPVDDEIEILPTPPKPIPAVITLSDDETSSSPSSSPVRKKAKQTGSQSQGEYEGSGSARLQPESGSAVTPFGTRRPMTAAEILKYRDPVNDKRPTLDRVPAQSGTNSKPGSYSSVPPPPSLQTSTTSTTPTTRTLRRGDPDQETYPLTSQELARFSPEFASLFRDKSVFKCSKCCAFYTVLAQFQAHDDLHFSSNRKACDCPKCGWRIWKNKVNDHMSCAHATPSAPAAPAPPVWPIPPPTYQNQQVAAARRFEDFTTDSSGFDFEIRPIIPNDLKFFVPFVGQRFYGRIICKCELCPRFFMSEAHFNTSGHSQLHWNRNGVTCKWCGWLLNRSEIPGHNHEFHPMM